MKLTHISILFMFFLVLSVGIILPYVIGSRSLEAYLFGMLYVFIVVPPVMYLFVKKTLKIIKSNKGE